MKQGTNIPDVTGSNSLGRGGSASIPNIASNSDSVKPDVLACEPSVIIGLLNPSVIIWFFGVFENLGFCCQ